MWVCQWQRRLFVLYWHCVQENGMYLRQKHVWFPRNVWHCINLFCFVDWLVDYRFTADFLRNNFYNRSTYGKVIGKKLIASMPCAPMQSCWKMNLPLIYWFVDCLIDRNWLSYPWERSSTSDVYELLDLLAKSLLHSICMYMVHFCSCNSVTTLDVCYCCEKRSIITGPFTQTSNGRLRLSSSSVTLYGRPAGGLTRAGQAMTSCHLQSNYSSTAAWRASSVTSNYGDTLLMIVQDVRWNWEICTPKFDV